MRASFRRFARVPAAYRKPQLLAAIAAPVATGSASEATHSLWKHAVLGLGIVAGTTVLASDGKPATADGSATLFAHADAPRKDLPTFTFDDVAQHKPATTKDGRLWVSFKCGVYDITEFVVKHPGGDKILLAAGGPLEPFWSLYAVHKASKQASELLESLRIGNLDLSSVPVAAKAAPNDPFANEPVRLPLLRVLAAKPFNAEVPPELLTDSFITPNPVFFVRNHLPVPQVDPADYSLTVVGNDNSTLRLSLRDLMTKFPTHTITSVVQCGGNRRSEMGTFKPVRGLDWKSGAISNAAWTGVWLRDVLMAAGVPASGEGYAHVQFEGLDKDEAGSPYGASIPIDKAMNASGDVMLAFLMNGELIPRDHGFPVRVIVPGTVGSRNVKWVSRIIPSKEESKSFWQTSDYKVLAPWVTWETAAEHMKTTPAMQAMPVQAAITTPAQGSTVAIDADDTSVSVGGYAWAGGGRAIVRVDVSIDGGLSWLPAKLDRGEDEKGGPHAAPGKNWAWTLWNANVTLPPELATAQAGGKVEIIAKAVDDQGNTQPERVSSIWNIRGLCNNAASRVNVNIAVTPAAEE